MHQVYPVALLLQQPGDAPGVGDVAGDHQPARLGVVGPHPLQPLTGLEQ